MIILSEEQINILDHTLHRAAGNRYCGDSEAMQGLVKQGLMQSLGKASWCLDEFFIITPAGCEAYRSLPEPALAKRRC